MSRYQIKNVENKESAVELELIEGDNGVILLANSWLVFRLRDTGVGVLYDNIPDNNDAGLQVDKNGKLIIVARAED